MNLSLPKILEVFPDFNRRVHDDLDFWMTCDAQNLTVVERIYRKKGYYVPDEFGDLIFIDSRLKHFLWLTVAFHELTHALLHYPSPYLAGKHQFEANAFSIMAICPLSELDAGSSLREAAKLNKFARFIIKERENIYFLYQDFKFQI